MNVQQIPERVDYFLNKIKTAHPDTPDEQLDILRKFLFILFKDCTICGSRIYCGANMASCIAQKHHKEVLEVAQLLLQITLDTDLLNKFYNKLSETERMTIAKHVINAFVDVQVVDKIFAVLVENDIITKVFDALEIKGADILDAFVETKRRCELQQKRGLWWTIPDSNFKF